MNTEFQRITGRDKKAFFSYQCKEIEENNRMGKTRDLVKKIRDTKETFHAKMGLIKDRNSTGLTEAEDMKKRWQEYTESEFTQSCPTLCDPWTVAHQVPPSMGFSRQEYWSGLPFPSPEDLPDPRIEPGSPALRVDALTSEPPGSPGRTVKKRSSQPR